MMVKKNPVFAFLLAVACVFASFDRSDAIDIGQFLESVLPSFGSPAESADDDGAQEESAILTTAAASDGVLTITEEFYNIPQEEEAFTSEADALLSVQEAYTVVFVTEEEDSSQLLQPQEQPQEQNFFRVINESPQRVWAAVGAYPDASSNMKEEAWTAQGWFAVEPYATETIWTTQDPRIYVRLEQNGPIEPLVQQSNANFCIHPLYDFYSEETLEYESFYLELMQTDLYNGFDYVEARDGESCADAGGEHHRFYLYDTNTDFLIV
jgi:hypothetical protein